VSVCLLFLIGDVVVVVVVDHGKRAHSVCVFESIVFKIHCLTPFGVRGSLNRLQHSSRIFVLTAFGTESLIWDLTLNSSIDLNNLFNTDD
jgi:hypothetical protein